MWWVGKAIKEWRWGWPGNEATQDCGDNCTGLQRDMKKYCIHPGYEANTRVDCQRDNGTQIIKLWK